DPTPRDQPIIQFRNASWISYNLQNHSYLSITNKSENPINFRQKEYAFWMEYFPKLSGRDPIYGVTVAPIIQETSEFEMATWSLTAGVALLSIVVLSCCVLMCKRSRTKNY
ncbi:hypothetical protein LOTGIDRAFT_176378, partial [Lottia gigantea]